MRASVQERAQDRISELAGRGYDLVTFWEECTEVLGAAVPHYDKPCWYTVDPASLLITSHYHDGLPEYPAKMLRHEYYGDDVNKISDVVRRVGGNLIDDPAYYRPALDALVDLFGPDRVIYGSNWAVSERVAPYATVHGVVAAYFAGRGRELAEKYFWRNSRAIYRWVPRGATTALPS